MKAQYYLSSVHFEDWFHGAYESKEHADEYAEELDVYAVMDGERVRIQPRLPESWHGLSTYLPMIGCPPKVVQAITDGVKRVVGTCEGACLAARLRDDDSLDIFIIWQTGKVLELVLMFEDSEEE